MSARPPANTNWAASGNPTNPAWLALTPAATATAAPPNAAGATLATEHSPPGTAARSGWSSCMGSATASGDGGSDGTGEGIFEGLAVVGSGLNEGDGEGTCEGWWDGAGVAVGAGLIEGCGLG